MSPLLNKPLKLLFSALLLAGSFYYFLLGENILSKKALVISNTNLEEFQIKKDIIEKFVPRENFDINESLVKKNIIKETASLDIRKNDELLNVYNKINEIIVKKNQTFGSILNDLKITKKENQQIISSISEFMDLRKLSIGQKIIFYFKSTEDNKSILDKIIIPLNFKEEIIVRKIDNKFLAKKNVLPIINENKVFVVKIINSIFEDGLKSKIPTSVLIDFIRLYSFDFDFQRDIRKNDEFYIMYEVYYNNQRREVAYGDILYANLIVQTKELEYFLYETVDGIDYFDRKGKNVRKALMKTPLDGARLSSGFGMRKHPILGYNVKHKGLDFAAPKGTPVFAAGNGIIEYAGRNGAYGKYIRIRHNNSYKTAYAHLNGFKKGISKGSRVNQGETIGYVGSTGRSTGPHLHYEVIFNGEKINPMKMKLPSKKSLAGEELKVFTKYSKNTFNEVLKNIQDNQEKN